MLLIVLLRQPHGLCGSLASSRCQLILTEPIKQKPAPPHLPAVVGPGEGHLRHSQLNVQEDPLLLPHVNLPHTVFAFCIGLWPVWRQHHSSHGRELPTTHGCNRQTDGQAQERHHCEETKRAWWLAAWGMKLAAVGDCATSLCVHVGWSWGQHVCVYVHGHTYVCVQM